MWILENTLLVLPTWFWFVVSGTGAILYFCSGLIQAIPFAQAKLAGVSIKYIGLALLLSGIYLTGGAGVTSAMQDAVNEMKDKVAKSEEKSKDANKKLDAALKDKTAAIKEAQKAVQQNIKRDAAKMDASCKVDSTAIFDLNEAAKPPTGKVTVQGAKQ